MIYYLISVAICLLISGILLALLFRALRINQSHRNRHPAGFLTPIALTLVFVVFTIRLTAPQVIDLVPLVTHTYSIEEIEIQPGSLGWNSLVLEDDARFFFNQWQVELKEGRTYRIEFTPRAHYLVTATPVDTVQAIPRHFGLSEDEDAP